MKKKHSENIFRVLFVIIQEFKSENGFFCWSNVFHNNTLISLSASHYLGNGTLAPLGHDSFVIFFFDERFVDHLDHRVAAEDAFGSHQVVEFHSQLEIN